MPEQVQTQTPLLSEMVKRAATENAAMVDPTSAAAVTSEKPGVSKWAKMLYGTGVGADASTTAYFQSHPKLGIHEANPLLNWAPTAAQIPIGAGMELAAILLGKKLLGDKHPKILNALVGGAGLAHAGFAAKNASLIGQKTADRKRSVFID